MQNGLVLNPRVVVKNPEEYLGCRVLTNPPNKERVVPDPQRVP